MPPDQNNPPPEREPRYHWLLSEAETVADMGRRVVEVLGRQPNDTMYAANKMRVALKASTEALVYAGVDDLESLLTLVREAHGTASETLDRAGGTFD